MQLWMLVDGVGTSVAHLGTLLEPVPKGSVVPTSLANGGAYFVPARLAPQTCASTRFLGGVAGGCDADGSWRVFSIAPSRRQVKRPCHPSAMRSC